MPTATPTAAKSGYTYKIGEKKWEKLIMKSLGLTGSEKTQQNGQWAIL